MSNTGGGKPRSKRAAQAANNASSSSSKTNAHACSKVVHVLLHALFPLLEHGPLLPAEATEDDNVGKELLLSLQQREESAAVEPVLPPEPVRMESVSMEPVFPPEPVRMESVPMEPACLESVPMESPVPLLQREEEEDVTPPESRQTLSS